MHVEVTNTHKNRNRVRAGIVFPKGQTVTVDVDGAGLMEIRACKDLEWKQLPGGKKKPEPEKAD
jgi:hypothetical protein